MEKAIEDVCKYYAQFSYPPKEMEIYIFLSEKISFQRFRNNLKNMCMSHRLVKQVFDKDERFQIIENESMFRSSSRKYERGKLYFDQVRSILKYLKIVPAIKYVGISGSLSMLHVGKRSDSDIFIITSSDTIWRTRFILLIYKHLLALFFPYIGKKLCFNLFFAENQLVLRKKKQNIYIGHEILQLKTIINKDQIYEKLIAENNWMVKFFPNIDIKNSREQKINRLLNQSKIYLYIGTIFEKIAKHFQIWWLKQKKIDFDDFGAQVWFIQEDFEEKLTFYNH